MRRGLRPIRPADAELIVAALAYTSPETYYRRFHAAKAGFRPDELKYLTDVDGKMHVALAAVERGEHPRLAAVARFSLDLGNPLEGELTIVVHDPFRCQGLATEMLRRLHDEASSRGAKRLGAMVQGDNVPMRQLLYHVFPDTRVAGFEGQEVDYLVPVHPHDAMQAACPVGVPAKGGRVVITFAILKRRLQLVRIGICLGLSAFVP